MFKKSALMIFFMAVILPANAEQRYEDLSDEVRFSLNRSVNDSAPARTFFDDEESGKLWLNAMSQRLKKILPANAMLQHDKARRAFLLSLHYESLRAGLPPQMVLAVVHVESAFRKYAISSVGARGYMQIMPFWQDLIGMEAQNLFRLRTNLRYGAVILRHYLDIEKGDWFRALGRYNGSLGRARYPNAVFAKWKAHWQWP